MAHFGHIFAIILVAILSITSVYCQRQCILRGPADHPHNHLTILLQILYYHPVYRENILAHGESGAARHLAKLFSRLDACRDGEVEVDRALMTALTVRFRNFNFAQPHTLDETLVPLLQIDKAISRRAFGFSVASQILIGGVDTTEDYAAQLNNMALNREQMVFSHSRLAGESGGNLFTSTFCVPTSPSQLHEITVKETVRRPRTVLVHMKPNNRSASFSYGLQQNNHHLLAVVYLQDRKYHAMVDSGRHGWISISEEGIKVASAADALSHRDTVELLVYISPEDLYIATQMNMPGNSREKYKIFLVIVILCLTLAIVYIRIRWEMHQCQAGMETDVHLPKTVNVLLVEDQDMLQSSIMV